MASQASRTTNLSWTNQSTREQSLKQTHSDSGSELPKFEVPDGASKWQNFKFRECYNCLVSPHTMALGHNLAFSTIIKPIIHPLSHVFIPKNRIECLLSCLRSSQEILSDGILSNNFCQEGNVKFHLQQEMNSFCHKSMESWSQDSSREVLTYPQYEYI